MKIITDLSVTSARMRPRAGWTPHLLFSADGVGAWYDIADTSTLFADMAGFAPAVVNGPVGLILDKSRALSTGPELVSNGNFDVDHSGWSVAGPVDVSTSGGVVTVDQPGASGGIFQDIPLTAGQGDSEKGGSVFVCDETDGFIAVVLHHFDGSGWGG
jgi:hypothetical protein